MSIDLVCPVHAFLHTGDRKAVSIWSMVRKNDGGEEVEQMLSTMTKYGNERVQFESIRNMDNVELVVT